MRFSVVTAMNALNVGASINGPAIPSEYMTRASMQAVFTGSSPTGTLNIQGSNDPPGSGDISFTPTNWSNIPGATVSVSGAAGVNLIQVNELCFRWVRASWTFTSGTGACTANLMLQGGK